MEAGTNWGGRYSRWGFDEEKAYVMLAKQMLGPLDQPVPLLDDELNSQAEILLTLLRRAIHRTHGDGSDNDGFKIAASGTNQNNNFTITGGNGTLHGAGYMFVNGWMPFLLSGIEYTSQAGVASLTTPAGNRTDSVYLDCWLDEVDGTEDSALIDTSVGFETSRRLKLNWVIKVVEGGATPGYYTDASGCTHWTAVLAWLNRTAGDAEITEGRIVDARNRGRMSKRGEYVHTQSAAAASWSITHGLRTKYVRVSVYDSNDKLVEVPVTISSVDAILIDFGSLSVAGYAVIQAVTSY